MAGHIAGVAGGGYNSPTGRGEPLQRNFTNSERLFWAKVSMGRPDECWLWLGPKSGPGYGQFRLSGYAELAHRVAWMLVNGPIPEGLFICHHCDTPLCCNPKHLYAGTAQDNALDVVERDRFPARNRKSETCICGRRLAGRQQVYCSDHCRWLAWDKANPRQRSLFPVDPIPQFDGETIQPEDRHRLARQLEAVKRLMLDGEWRSLSEIGIAVRAPEASVSARLRDLRKLRFGGYRVERKRLNRGLHLYRVVL